MRRQLTPEQWGTLLRARREYRVLVTLIDGHVAIIVPWRCKTEAEQTEVIARLTDALAGLDLPGKDS